MFGKVRFHDRVFSIMSHAATAVLMTAILPFAAAARNPVPPTARQAAQIGIWPNDWLVRQVRSGRSAAGIAARPSRSTIAGRLLDRDGPVNGTTDAWTINFGYVVSGSFTAGVGTPSPPLTFTSGNPQRRTERDRFVYRRLTERRYRLWLR